MNPRSDLVKLFICSTCSLQAALYTVTGQLSKVVGSLKDLFKGYCAKYLAVIEALILILYSLTHFFELYCMKILKARSHRSLFVFQISHKF